MKINAADADGIDFIQIHSSSLAKGCHNRTSQHFLLPARIFKIIQLSDDLLRILMILPRRFIDYAIIDMGNCSFDPNSAINRRIASHREAFTVA
jgi:hypothetical protein